MFEFTLEWTGLRSPTERASEARAVTDRIGKHEALILPLVVMIALLFVLGTPLRLVDLMKIVPRDTPPWNFLLGHMTASVRSNQTDRCQRVAMFNVLSTVIALPGSRPTMSSGVNMSTIVSLHLGFTSWLEQARGWFLRSLRPQTGGESGDQDDLYEIFLFGPHG